MIIGFAKYEGTGNDFIIIDGRALDLEFVPEFVAALCDRHFGIGGDGLMLLGPGSGKADFDMRHFNSDGFQTAVCGNGGSCIVLYAHHQGVGSREKIFSAADGIHRAKIGKSDDLRGTVELQLDRVGIVEQNDDHIIMKIGSPHYVRFVTGLEDVDVVAEGREICSGPAFRKKDGNVNFVEIAGKGSLLLRTYDGNIGNEVQACGAGAAAAATAAHAAGQTACTDFSIKTRGGVVKVSFKTDGNGLFSDVWLRETARKVFHGKFESDNFTGLL